MNDSYIKLLKSSCAVLSLLTTLAFGVRAAEPSNGEALFSQRCAKCHSSAKLMPTLTKRPLSERQSYLEGIMAKHFPPPVAQRPPIATYLTAQSAK
jgi:mono/diheme cytochrome c family protein